MRSILWSKKLTHAGMNKEGEHFLYACLVAFRATPPEAHPFCRPTSPVTVRARQFDSLQQCGFFKPGLRYVDYRILDGEKAYSADRLQNGIVAHVCFFIGPRRFYDALRVVTEYGVADLRGKVDQDVAKALINIADSRFQDGLLAKAKKAGKIPRSYRIPDCFRNNYPEVLADKLAPYREQGLFDAFPGGSELTEAEVAPGGALRRLKQKAGRNPLAVAATLAGQMLRPVSPKAAPYLQRMNLDRPRDIKERLLRKIVLAWRLTGISE